MDNTEPINKRARLNSKTRRDVILALAASGLGRQEIATKLGIHPKTVQYHTSAAKPAIHEASAQLQSLVEHITTLMPIEKRAGKYAALAMDAKNEAVSLGALQRIDDLDGIVTERERLRSKGVEHSTPAPMFIINNANIDMGGRNVEETASSSSDSRTDPLK